MRYILLTVITLFLISCGESTETKINKMVVAKNKWIAVSEGKDYSFEIVTKGHHTNSIQKIDVVNGKALNKYPKEIATIKGLFNYCFETIKNAENKIEITYNDDYGYPNEIKVTMPGYMDGSSTIIVQNLVLK